VSNIGEIGKLRRVPLREVWPHEAWDFTTWLERNPDVLSDILDYPRESVERERRAGSFSVDLVGEDSSGATVVIEN
jgi:RecB family endonuclease NucS